MLLSQFKWHELFVECIEALGSNVNLLSPDQSAINWKLLKNRIPITSWGRVDWNKMPQKISITWNIEIIPTLNKLLKRHFSESVLVFWNDGSLPVVSSYLNSVVGAFDDVISVAPDTWLVNFEEGYVIEIFHDGEITVGLIPSEE